MNIPTTDDPRRAIVELAAARQQALGISNRAMGELIGVTGAAWSYVKAGQRQPGVRMLQGIRRAVPETTDLVMRLFFGP